MDFTGGVYGTSRGELIRCFAREKSNNNDILIFAFLTS
jgi:hypothetical protein